MSGPMTMLLTENIVCYGVPAPLIMILTMISVRVHGIYLAALRGE